MARLKEHRDHPVATTRPAGEYALLDFPQWRSMTSCAPQSSKSSLWGLSIVELTRRLAERGLLDEWGDVDVSLLAAEVDDILTENDDTWMTPDGTVPSIASMFNGACISHRVTDLEIVRGGLDASRDLAVLDFGVHPSLHLASGDEVCVHFARGEGGDDQNSSYVGPVGWLLHDGSPTVV